MGASQLEAEVHQVTRTGQWDTFVSAAFCRPHRATVVHVGRDYPRLDREEMGVPGGHLRSWLPCSYSLWQRGWKLDLTFPPHPPTHRRLVS